MIAGDHGLQLKPPRRETAHRGIQDEVGFLDQSEIPASAILIFQQHEDSAAEPGRQPRLRIQLEREQSFDLGVAGHLGKHGEGQPQRLIDEVHARPGAATAGKVALVEHQIDDTENHIEALAQILGDRQGDAGIPNLALRAHDPLRDGRLGDQQGRGDLVGRQAAHQAQRERDLRLGCQRRVTAEQDEPQPFVTDASEFNHGIHLLLTRVAEGIMTFGGQHREVGCIPGAPERSLLTADPVDSAIAGHRVEPGRGVVGNGCPIQRLNERVLHGLIGGIQPEPAREESDDSPALLASQPSERLPGHRGAYASGRTSVAEQADDDAHDKDVEHHHLPFRGRGLLALTGMTQRLDEIDTDGQEKLTDAARAAKIEA